MRRIGHEARLLVECAREPCEQPFDGSDEGLDLCGQAALAQGLRIDLVGGVEPACQSRQRREVLAQDNPHHHHQRRNQREQGQQRAPAAVERDLVAHGSALSDGDALAVVERAQEQAPGLAVARGGVQAVGQRGIEPAGRKRLDDQLRFGLGIGVGTGRQRGRSAAAKLSIFHQPGHLLELFILKFVRVLVGKDERRRRRDHSGQPDDKRQPDRQPDLQGVLHVGRSTIQPMPRTFLITAAPSFLRMAWISTSTMLLSISSPQP